MLQTEKVKWAYFEAFANILILEYIKASILYIQSVEHVNHTSRKLAFRC